MGELFMNPLEIYSEYFRFVPSCFQADLIDNTVTDLARWRETVEFWAGSGYRPQNVLGMLRHYEKTVPNDWLPVVLAEHRDRDARLVEIATIEVLMTSKADIKHVNYFKPAIESLYMGLARGHELLDRPVSSELIDIILERRRKQYSKVNYGILSKM